MNSTVYNFYSSSSENSTRVRLEVSSWIITILIIALRDDFAIVNLLYTLSLFLNLYSLRFYRHYGMTDAERYSKINLVLLFMYILVHVRTQR